MSKYKTYLSIVTLIIAAISLVVMVFGFFIHTTLAGFFAACVFGLSFYMFVQQGIPKDDFFVK